MPSPRRYRVLTYLIVAGIVTLLFFASQSRDQAATSTRAASSAKGFYDKTVEAMDKHKHAHAHGGSDQKVVAEHGDIHEDADALHRGVADRLRQAEQAAKDSAEAKGPKQPEVLQHVVGQENLDPAAVAHEKAKGKGGEPQRDREVEEVLNEIMKKSPVIIFSKSYCPYSKAAKGILLEKYTIEPAPYVVELDNHPLGSRIQARLGEMTGRRTVPNVMIYGQSIGGGDEVSAMDRSKTLADKIQSLAGDRVAVSLRFEQGKEKAG
ncbi:hypothetical protein VTJ49DRAFT_1077 [Mycothermus thermophilus]|uniref:Glutaredoxin domain-containing protein n=1 Tax=Humicola insolens TaxID=85995 RepID=A0ABR3VEK8_HUMIN